MSPTTASRLLPHALGTAASTGVGMIPLHRLPRPVRTGYVVLPAAFVTGTMLLAMQRAAPEATADAAGQTEHTQPDVVQPEGEQPESEQTAPAQTGLPQTAAPGLRAPTLSEAALATALGGLVAGAGAASLGLDRAIEGVLRRRGVPAPRLWMGLASGALTLALTVLDERAPAPSETVEDPFEERVLELLDAADPMALTPGQGDGSPADEYQVEAETIAQLLRSEGRVSTAQLDEVWQEWFDEPLTARLGQERTAALAAALSALTSAQSAR